MKALYSPTDENLPVEVLISILEYEATTQKLVLDSDRISQALLSLDAEDIGPKSMEIISQQATWSDFKKKLTDMFAGQISTKTKINLLLNLVKSDEENCHHFLIRVRYVAGILTPSCSCPPFIINSDELVSVLFFAGLQEVEREMCLKRNLSLDEYADMLNCSMPIDGVSTPEGVKMEHFDADDDDFYKTELDDPTDPNQIVQMADVKGNVEIMGINKLNEDDTGKRCPHKDCHFVAKQKASLHCHLNPVHYNIDEEGLYLCDQCDFKDAKKKVLEIHMSSHNLEDAGELAHIKVENEHQSLDPDDKGNYICQQCHYHTQSSRMISVHLKKHTGRVMRYNCQHCAYTTQSAETLEKHLSHPHLPVFCSQGYEKCGAHKNQACRIYRCGKCQYSTAHREEFSYHVKDHVREVTSADDDYHYQSTKGDATTYFWVCQYCAASFPSELARMDHLEKVHLSKVSFSCHVCSFKTNKSYLKGEHVNPPHISINSNGQRCCGLCSFETPKLEAYLEHVAGHFNNPSNLSTNQCTHCAKRFPDEELLKLHMDEVHLMSGIRYKCSLCSYRAPHANKLAHHVKTTHQGLKKYQCDHCSKQFSERGNLKRHIETIHVGKDERDVYECPICKISLTQKASLTAHVKNVHNETLGEFRIIKAAEAVSHPKKSELTE